MTGSTAAGRAEVRGASPAADGAAGQEKLRRRARTLALPALVLAIGMLVAILNYLQARETALRSLELKVAANVDNFAGKLSTELSEWLVDVEATAQAGEFALKATRALQTHAAASARRALLSTFAAHFHSLTARLLLHRLGYTGFSWSQMIDDSERSTFEADRAAVTGDVRPVRDFDGSSTPAPTRQRYLPVLLHHQRSHPILMRDRFTHAPSNATLWAALARGATTAALGPLPLYEARAATGILGASIVWDCAALQSLDTATAAAGPSPAPCAPPNTTDLEQRLQAVLGVAIGSVNLAAVGDELQRRLGHLEDMHYSVTLNGQPVWRSPLPSFRPADTSSTYSALEGRAQEPPGDAASHSATVDHAAGVLAVMGKATPALTDEALAASLGSLLTLAVIVGCSFVTAALVGVFTVRLHRVLEQEERDRAASEREQLMGFLQKTSHDMRSPLQTITMASELLMGQVQRFAPSLGAAPVPRSARSSKRKTPMEALNATLTTMIGASSVLRLIADNVLDVSRIGRGEVAEVLEHHADLAAEAKTLVKVMSFSTYASTRVKVTSICSSKVPAKVVVDREKLLRVLLNLVNNSLKFTQQGTVQVIVRLATEQEVTSRLRALHAATGFRGTARVLVGDKAKPAIVVDREFELDDQRPRPDKAKAASGAARPAPTKIAASATASGSADVAPAPWVTTPDPDLATHVGVLVAVRDTGAGMTPEELARSATAWSRASLKAGGGYGLGLRVVAEFVAALGGRLGAASEKGAGTIFSFVLAARIVQSARERERDHASKAAMFSGTTRQLMQAANSAESSSDNETGSDMVNSSDEGRELVVLLDEAQSTSYIATTIFQNAGYKVEVAKDRAKLQRAIVRGTNRVAFVMVALSPSGSGTQTAQGASAGTDRVIAAIRDVRSILRHSAVTVPILGAVDAELAGRVELIARFAAEGVDGVVSLPFDMAAVQSVLRSVLRRRRAKGGSSTPTSEEDDTGPLPARSAPPHFRQLGTVPEETQSEAGVESVATHHRAQALAWGGRDRIAAGARSIIGGAAPPGDAPGKPNNAAGPGRPAPAAHEKHGEAARRGDRGHRSPVASVRRALDTAGVTVEVDAVKDEREASHRNGATTTRAQSAATERTGSAAAHPPAATAAPHSSRSPKRADGAGDAPRESSDPKHTARGRPPRRRSPAHREASATERVASPRVDSLPAKPPGASPRRGVSASAAATRRTAEIHGGDGHGPVPAASTS